MESSAQHLSQPQLKTSSQLAIWKASSVEAVMETQSQSETQHASADGAVLYSTAPTVMFEETFFDRMCYVLCCIRNPLRSSSNGSMTRPPGLTDSLERRTFSNETMYGVKSLSPDSVPAPVSGLHNRLLIQANKEHMSLKDARHSHPHTEQQQSTEPTVEPQSSTSISSNRLTQYDLTVESSEPLAKPKSDDPESINLTTERTVHSEGVRYRSVGRAVVRFWSSATQLKLPFRRRSHRSTKPSKESLNPKPSATQKPDDLESVELMVDCSGSSRAVFEKYKRTQSEASYLLTGDEGTSKQTLGISLSTPIKGSPSMDKLDVVSKSRESMSEKMSSSSEDKLTLKSTESTSTTQPSTGAEKMTAVGEYLPLLEDSSTCTQVSEMSIPTPTKGHFTEDEFDFISKSTESLSSAQASVGAEKAAAVGGNSPFLTESTGALTLRRSMSAQIKSSSSGLDLGSTSKSTDSLTTHPSGAEKAGVSSYLKLAAESTGAQSVSSGIEFDLFSKSPEFLSTVQQPIGEKTAGSGRPFLKATSEQIVETSTSSVKSYELEFTTKSTESSPIPKQSTDGEEIEKAETERSEQTEVSGSQPVTSSKLEKGDFSSECPQDEEGDS